MKHITALDRVVENEYGHTVRVRAKSRFVELEIGTDTTVTSVPFEEPNDLRALAGHIAAIADALQRQQQGGGYGTD